MMEPTIKTDKYELWLGDCLEIMPLLEAQSVDAVIADVPYGTTQCEWDIVIPFAPMWENIWRVCVDKPNVLMFSAQPFTTDLIVSQRDKFRYEIIWEKTMSTRFLDANRRPLLAHENILMFGNGFGIYNPQKDQGFAPETRQHKTGGQKIVIYNKNKRVEWDGRDGTRHPRTVIKFSNHNGALWGNTDKATKHHTQKPIPLLSYLVKTYTNEGKTVLDFTMGSGSTGVSAIENDRYFIGIEKDEKYFEVAKDRLTATALRMKEMREFGYPKTELEKQHPVFDFSEASCQ